MNCSVSKEIVIGSTNISFGFKVRLFIEFEMYYFFIIYKNLNSQRVPINVLDYDEIIRFSLRCSML